mmetsp:Transcript_23702/g.40484  ORF Transcript_23702/g.40484 Transcript_23702/m.40484 type:complete len:287 (+) Transcript_23702:255-1115(+)
MSSATREVAPTRSTAAPSTRRETRSPRAASRAASSSSARAGRPACTAASWDTSPALPRVRGRKPPSIGSRRGPSWDGAKAPSPPRRPPPSSPSPTWADVPTSGRRGPTSTSTRREISSPPARSSIDARPSPSADTADRRVTNPVLTTGAAPRRGRMRGPSPGTVPEAPAPRPPPPSTCWPSEPAPTNGRPATTPSTRRTTWSPSPSPNPPSERSPTSARPGPTPDTAVSSLPSYSAEVKDGPWWAAATVPWRPRRVPVSIDSANRPAVVPRTGPCPRITRRETWSP